MNPTLGIKKLSLFDNTLSIILYLFLVQSDAAFHLPYKVIVTPRTPLEHSFSYHQPAGNQKLPLAKELNSTEGTTGYLINKLQFTNHTKLLDTDSKLQTRTTELESNTNDSQTSVDNIRQNIAKKIDTDVDEKTYNLSKSLQYLNDRLAKFQYKISFHKGGITSQIVNDVKSRRFSAAHVKLHALYGDEMFHSVFQKIYNNQASNFDLLMDFGGYINNIIFKCRIYDFLFKQTVAGGFNNLRKILRLRKSIKREIIDRTDGVIPKINIHYNYNMLTNSVEEAAVEPIYSALLYNNSWTTVKQLSTEISEDCPECINRIFNMVIKTIWNKITIDDLLCRAHQNLNFKENIAVHLAVMNTLKNTGGLHNTSAITFARVMKLIMEDSKYKNESLERKSQYEEAKNEIPESVKNLVFSSAICIKDTRHNEYLYAAAAPDYVYDDNRRHVYTWIPGDRDEPPKFKWYVKFYNSHEIVLRNDKYNEYLYADGISYDDTRRYVFTWRPGNTVTSGIWRVEIDGNYINLFNTEHGGYLFADDNEMKDKSRRYVFINRKGEKTSDSKWEIVDCSNFN